jgi:hypothetical protein
MSFALLWAALWGAGRAVLAFVAPILRARAVEVLAVALPVALEIVRSLAASREDGERKRQVAVRQLGHELRQRGIDAAESALNLAVELAVARLKSEPAQQPPQNEPPLALALALVVACALVLPGCAPTQSVVYDGRSERMTAYGRLVSTPGLAQLATPLQLVDALRQCDGRSGWATTRALHEREQWAMERRIERDAIRRMQP